MYHLIPRAYSAPHPSGQCEQLYFSFCTDLLRLHSPSGVLLAVVRHSCDISSTSCWNTFAQFDVYVGVNYHCTASNCTTHSGISRHSGSDCLGNALAIPIVPILQNLIPRFVTICEWQVFTSTKSIVLHFIEHPSALLREDIRTKDFRTVIQQQQLALNIVQFSLLHESFQHECFLLYDRQTFILLVYLGYYTKSRGIQAKTCFLINSSACCVCTCCTCFHKIYLLS